MEDLQDQLTWVASDLDRLGYRYAGVVRQAARALALGDLSRRDPSSSGACERCGRPIVQPWTGKRRKYCTSCSPRRRELKTPENGFIDGSERDAG